jgi:diguanylate cyclase (GGDEF)-like protein
MTTISNDEETVEAQALSTSLDPYGQLIKMLMPRAQCIAIYDRLSTPLWLSDGCDGSDLQQLAEEALNAARSGVSAAEERDGFARSWEGDSAYVFILRDGANLLGALGISSRDSSSGSRPFSLVQGLLRPAIQVLSRELLNQYQIGDLQKHLSSRKSEVVPLEASDTDEDLQSDDLEQLLQNCASHVDCSLGTLLIPDKKLSISIDLGKSTARLDREALERTQRHLFAWSQVQRRTLILNKAPPAGPLGTVPYKILACPVRHGTQNVVGILAFFKPLSGADFDARHVRLAEVMARRIAYVLQNAYDPSTGLLTRPAFEQRALTMLAASEPDAQHCVVYGDIDRLHVVNENYGMHIGDDVIVRIAEGIREHLPANVTASRISGDRFALFFPNVALETTQAFVEHLCGQIKRLDHQHEGKSIDLSMSFGVASIPSTKYPLSHGLAVAEVACKAAKDRGRGRVETYQDADRSIVRRYEDVHIIGDLRDAIANDRFRMEAQPIVQLDGIGPTRRFELLLRMIDPSGANIAPDKFFSAAERYQLATDIDRWVVQYALEVLSSAAPALDAMGAHFAINISGQSLGDDDFHAYLAGKLGEYNLPPRMLSFEITETAAVANIVKAETLVRRLQDLGYGIALDDFGRGLSSLTYLKSLPVSNLKIDGGLVRDLVGNARAQAMVAAIVQLAQAMNLKTTAECVESEAIQSAVAELGVHYGQGFAIGRPRPLELVLQELLRGAPGAARQARSSLVTRLVG